MSPSALSQSQSVKRRRSILSTVRPLTAGGDHSFGPRSSRSHTGVWVPHEDGSYREAVSHFAHEPMRIANSNGSSDLPSTIDSQRGGQSTNSMPKRHHSKSFSGLRNGVGGIRAVVRRLSVSMKHKPPKEMPWEGDAERISAGEPKSGRFQRNHIPRQSSLGSLNMLGQNSPGDIAGPIPGSGSKPPVLPGDLSRGAAARAAAAAQNEMVKLEREVSNTSDSRRDDDLRVDRVRDSESGIEINMEDRSDCSEYKLEVIRKDPVRVLPAELMAQVLSLLDAGSLRKTELVSRGWHAQSSSRHVWREVFRSQYERQPMSSRKGTSGGQRSIGVGKTAPNQDWKKMFAVRRALEKRWNEGKAAAIYLHGHKDSVYCVQFDENKIITGSRDRTIRVWDAKFPWPCLKVIGVPSEPSSPAPIGPVNINPPTDSPGSSPFISICPPAQPAMDLMTSGSQTDDYHRASVLCLQFDDEVLVTGSSDTTCIVWDIKNDYQPIRRLEGHRSAVLDVALDDRYIVTSSKDTTVNVWDRHTGDLLKHLVGHRGPVNSVQLRGDLIVSASSDGLAKLWNLTSGLCIKEFDPDKRGLACVDFSENARTIITGGNGKSIHQFDANTGELVKQYDGHSELVRSLHLDSTAGRIVSGSYDRSLKVYDANSGQLSIEFPGWTSGWLLSVKSDYRRIIASSQDARAVIMDFGYGLDGIDLLEA